MDDAPILSAFRRDEKTLVIAGTPEDVRRHWPSQEALLSEVELQRADAFHEPADREAFIASHALARVAVGELAGVPADAVTIAQRCERCGGPHGRPVVAEHPELCVSWSHARSYVAAAAGEQQIAVDVEDVLSPRFDERVAERVLTVAELAEVRESADPAHAFLGHWVRKECCVKLGLTELDDLQRDIDLTGWVSAYWEAPEAIGCAVAKTRPHIELLSP